MSSHDPSLDALLDRFYAGRCTDAEAARVRTYLQERLAARGMTEIWDRQVVGASIDGGFSEEHPFDLTGGMDALRARIGQPVSSAPPRSLRPHSIHRHGISRNAHRFSWSRITWRTLGGVAALLGILAVWYYADTPVRLAPSTIRYATHAGQRVTVTLVDGSRVMLAPQTTLRMAPNGHAERTIWLDGEAYFDVQPSRTPFVVHTGRMITRVLGTTFGVRQYATDMRAYVAVTTGKVMIVPAASQRAAVTLTAGMVGTSTDSMATILPTVDAAQALAWTTGRLVFHNAPATDVLDAIARWYGYQFRFSDSALVRERLTVGISTESSAAALATLKQNLDVDYTIDGNVITLHPRRVESGTAPDWRLRNRNTLTIQTEAGR